MIRFSVRTIVISLIVLLLLLPGLSSAITPEQLGIPYGFPANNTGNTTINNTYIISEMDQTPNMTAGSPGLPGAAGSDATIAINATFEGSPPAVVNVGTTGAALFDFTLPGNYNASYWTGTNYNASYLTSTYNATYDSFSNYNASYLTSTFNATYDAKTNYNSSYWTGTNYNSSYWTGTNYNSSYWIGTNYNASYLTSTYNATYDAKTNYNSSYWTGTNYNASYATTSYVDAVNTSMKAYVDASGGSNYNATYDAKPTFAQIYPVGSIYISVVSTSPATLFGFGTWAAFGTGRIPIGINASDTQFDVVKEVGGSNISSEVMNHTHTATVTDAGHNHLQTKNTATAGALSGYGIDGSTATSGDSGYYTKSNTTGISVATANPAGGVTSFSIMNPYIVVYMWERTA